MDLQRNSKDPRTPSSAYTVTRRPRTTLQTRAWVRTPKNMLLLEALVSYFFVFQAKPAQPQKLPCRDLRTLTMSGLFVLSRAGRGGCRGFRWLGGGWIGGGAKEGSLPAEGQASFWPSGRAGRWAERGPLECKALRPFHFVCCAVFVMLVPGGGVGRFGWLWLMKGRKKGGEGRVV